MIKLFKCKKLCTVSDREVKCDRCGKKTKFLCNCKNNEERDIIVRNLQAAKLKLSKK